MKLPAKVKLRWEPNPDVPAENMHGSPSTCSCGRALLSQGQWASAVHGGFCYLDDRCSCQEAKHHKQGPLIDLV